MQAPFWPMRATFDGTAKSQTIGDPAKRWTILPDALTYTFEAFGRGEI
jgi:hypothetical protein